MIEWIYHICQGGLGVKRKLTILLVILSLCLFPLPAARSAESVYEEAGYTEEERLEAPSCSVVLRWKPLSQESDVRDYELWLLYPSGKRERLLLPSTAIGERDPSYAPTDRPPDLFSLRDDRSTLTYVYRFEKPLIRGDTLLHQAGVYTYTVDLATGELNVTHAETEFSDVSPEDWFAPYVKACVNAGLMKGVGDGRFDPQRKLSDRESTVMALRLTAYEAYFPALPEDWSRAVITTQDGTVLRANCAAEGGWDYDLAWSWQNIGGTETIAWRLGTQAQKDWGRSVDCQPGYIDIAGTGFSGYCYLYEAPSGLYLYFKPADPVSGQCADCLRCLRESGSWPEWYREAAYYALNTYQGRLLTDRGQATRDSFAWKLGEVTRDLPTINVVDALPDSEAGYVLSLYKKGILAGVDEHLTFHPEGSLTRAEAAAMLARVAVPELRLQFAPPERAEYTLTDMGMADRDTQFGGVCLAQPNYLILSHAEAGENFRYTLLRGDGQVLELGADDPAGWGEQLLVLKREKEDHYGVLDVNTLEMARPFGYWGYPGYSSCRILEGEEYFMTGDPEEYGGELLWDAQGNRIMAVDSMTSSWWRRFHEGLRREKRESLWGYVDLDNHFVIEPQWELCYDFEEGYAIVAKDLGRSNALWGVIDKTGTLVVPFQYNSLEHCGQGMFFYQLYSPAGTVAEKGMIRARDGKVFPADYASQALEFRNGYSPYTTMSGLGWSPGEKKIYINADMEPLTEPFDWAGPIGEDGAGFVGLNGRIFRIQFQEAPR